MNERRDLTTGELAAFMAKQLENNSVPVEFPQGLTPSMKDPARSRRDLRERAVFTIDCDDTQDMDDAVSLERTGRGYLLGVYIADVASFVEPGSPIDQVALDRGTSLYLPGRTIPMLPPVLSEDLCSLRPGVDRRVIAIEMRLDARGRVEGYNIGRAMIRSRVKGVYSEVNALLAGGAAAEVREKYRGFAGTLREMRALAGMLRAGRGGVREQAFVEPKIVVTGAGVELRSGRQGVAGEIIEEFMVLANRLVAEFFQSHGIPAIYRVQERRRTMAAYASAAGRHAELRLEKYMHFTSPIRRLADLRTHQSLSAFWKGEAAEEFFGESAMAETAELAVKRSRRAGNIQLACAKLCWGLYFRARPQMVSRGHVKGCDAFGRPVIVLDGLELRVQGPEDGGLQPGQRVSLRVESLENNRLIGRAVMVQPERKPGPMLEERSGVRRGNELTLPAWCRGVAAAR